MNIISLERATGGFGFASEEPVAKEVLGRLEGDYPSSDRSQRSNLAGGWKVSGVTITTSGYDIAWSEAPDGTVAVLAGLFHHSVGAGYLTAGPFGEKGQASNTFRFIDYHDITYFMHQAWFFIGADKKTKVYARSASIKVYITYPTVYVRGTV